MNLRALALLSLAALAACKSTTEEAPSDSGVIARDTPDVATDTATDSATDAAVDSAADVASNSAADVATDSAADVATDSAADVATDSATDVATDSATDAATDVAADASCVSDGGCFACPTTSSEIINRCTASSCARFDNRARLPRLLPDGGLPALP